jgi:F0F1-type ATP synthase assembly protein I
MNFALMSAKYSEVNKMEKKNISKKVKEKYNASKDWIKKHLTTSKIVGGVVVGAALVGIGYLLGRKSKEEE